MNTFEHDFLFLRATAEKDGRAYNGFQWPLEAGGIVEAPDWNPAPVCGGGLHGLADALGDRELLQSPASPNALWYVCGAIRAEAVSVPGDNGIVTKIKVPRCRVLYVGSLAGAMAVIAPHVSAAVERIVRERHAAGKPEGEAATGTSGAASATGTRGAASATGKHGVALAAGYLCRGMVTEDCLLVLVERDYETGRILHHFSALCGEQGIEPGVWYVLRNGKPEVAP